MPTLDIRPAEVEPYVSLAAVSFQYHRAAPILSGLDLKLARGEFFTLLGPSGCGKTTVLNLLAGFERPTQGQIIVAGKEVHVPGPDRVVIFQGDDSLLNWLTTLENIEFGLRLAGINARERRALAADALQSVGLSGQGDKYPHQLSGGMKQRVQIARALVCQADILLMDEPFGALDAQTRSLLQDELARIWVESRRTVLFITHDISEAIILGDRIGVMKAGPGSAISEVIVNDLSRPRSRGTVNFADMYSRIEQLVSTEVMRSMQGELE